MTDYFEHLAKEHAINREARWHRDAFFEKLAILDGGTVALVVTAVLAPLHSSVRHRLLLASGLACLVVALLALLVRNLAASEIEFHITDQELHSGVAANPRQKRLLRYAPNKRVCRYRSVMIWNFGLGG